MLVPGRRTLLVTAPDVPAGWMAGAARARVTSPPEASGCLVAPPVFKTGGRRAASSAGSIPVRLRHLRKHHSGGCWQRCRMSVLHRGSARWWHIGGTSGPAGHDRRHRLGRRGKTPRAAAGGSRARGRRRRVNPPPRGRANAQTVGPPPDPPRPWHMACRSPGADAATGQSASWRSLQRTRGGSNLRRTWDLGAAALNGHVRWRAG